MDKNYFLLRKTGRYLSLLLIGMIAQPLQSQVFYGSSASYGLRKVVPGYAGKAIQVRRTCDNGILDIGFTSCGDLDVTALQRFVVAANPLSAISSTVDAAYSLRRLKCTYAGSSINVRRSCDNGTKDIGFTVNGDLDTTALKAFVLQASPLSAISSAAAAAYSLRKLYCAYAGNAINVRRSSDNATQDIGFTTNGDLDTTSLKAFVGGASGYVTKWYDQSGNIRDAAQAAAANQPRIVNASVLDRQNGIPAMYYSGGAIYLTAATLTGVNATTTGNITTANFVFQSTNAIAGTLISNGDAGPNRYNIHTPWSDNNTYFDIGNIGAGGRINTGLTWSSLSIGTFIRNGAQGDVWKNGTNSLSAGTFATTVSSALALSIGGSLAYGSYMVGYISEVTVFPAALSITDRQYLEWSQSQYYSVAGPVLTTLPASPQSAYVTKWYDQSGNAYDLSQAATASQPRIINAGLIDRANGNAAVYFNGSSTIMQSTAYNRFINGQTPTWNAVVYPISTNSAYAPIVSWRAVGSDCNQLEVNGSSPPIWNISWLAVDWPTTNGTNVNYGSNQVVTSLVQATASQLYYNGSLSYNNTSQTNTASSSSYSTTPLYVGQDNCCGSRYFNGYMEEIVLSSTNMSTTDRQYLEWTQAQYYNINGPVLGTLPASPASAYVAKWYDQNGSGKNLVQAATANQPKIVNAGIVNLQGALAAISLDGSNYYMAEPTLSMGNPYTANTVATRTANGGSGGYQRLLNMSASGDAYGYLGVLSGNYATFAGNGVATWNDIAADAPATSVALNSQAIMSMAVSSGVNGLIPYLNGTAMTAKNGTAATSTGFLIGAPYNANNTNQLWTGNISEVHLFSSALSTTRRTIIENNQSAYFGTAISNSKYTVANGYNYNVTGVGRTSAVDSVADSRKSGGMGFIVGMAATDFLKDNGDYMITGMTCPTATVSFLNLPAGCTQRWDNDWYINKTDVNGNNGDITIYFDYTDYGVPSGPTGAPGGYLLLGRNSIAATFSIVTTTSQTIVGNRVLFTLPAANLGGVGYYTIGAIDFNTNYLPIELLEFSAIPNDEKVDLKWSTSTETNNDYFTIEKSKDGKNFTKLVDVKGAGNSTSLREYFDIDPEPYMGTSYYRLKQTDKNGAYKYFYMVPVTFNGKKNITVYPNPVGKGEALNIKVTGHPSQEVLVVLRDMSGREFSSKVLITEESNHIFSVSTLTEIPAGVYLVVASSNNKIYSYKLVVQ